MNVRPDSSKSAYSFREITGEETERLLKMGGYPTQVSMSLLGILQDQTVLDIGAGPNSALSQLVLMGGGRYVAVDRTFSMLEQLKRVGPDLQVVQADAVGLPIADGVSTRTHMRFLLAHLSGFTWTATLEEALRITNDSGSLFVLEHDWKTLSSSENQEIILRFLEVMTILANEFGIDLYAGQNLRALGIQLQTKLNAQIEERRFSRDEADYTLEFLAIIRSAQQMAKAKGLKELDVELADIYSMLESKPISFVPPDIVTLTIEKEHEH